MRRCSRRGLLWVRRAGVPHVRVPLSRSPVSQSRRIRNGRWSRVRPMGCRFASDAEPRRIHVRGRCPVRSHPMDDLRVARIRTARRTILLLAIACGLLRCEGPPASDAGIDACTDAPPPSRSCNASNETPTPVSAVAPCDLTSRTQCQDWAVANAGCPNAFALCNNANPVADAGFEKCRRADHCTSFFSTECFCGVEDACPPGAVCVADVPGAMPHCRCITR